MNNNWVTVYGLEIANRKKISLNIALNYSPNTLHVFTFVKLSTTLLRYNKLEKPERFHRTLGVEKNWASQD